MATAATLDEQGAHASRQRPDERPPPNLGLGDKGERHLAQQCKDVDPGDMVGCDEIPRISHSYGA